MKIYNYDEQGIFICESDAKENPIEQGKYLIPARATIIAPLTVGANEVAVFNGEQWQAKADFRGSVYYIGDDEFTIKDIGVEIPTDAISEADYQAQKQVKYEELTNSYSYKRQQEYPDYRELLDAEVKINSGNAILIAEGQAQKEAYISTCLAIKTKYPKE